MSLLGVIGPDGGEKMAAELEKSRQVQAIIDSTEHVGALASRYNLIEQLAEAGGLDLSLFGDFLRKLGYPIRKIGAKGAREQLGI